MIKLLSSRDAPLVELCYVKEKKEPLVGTIATCRRASVQVLFSLAGPLQFPTVSASTVLHIDDTSVLEEQPTISIKASTTHSVCSSKAPLTLGIKVCRSQQELHS